MMDVARNSKTLIYGIYGASLLSHNDEENLTDFNKTCLSIKEKDHICPTDISEKILNSEDIQTNDIVLKNDPSVFIRLSPLAFCDIYGFDANTLDELIDYIVTITHINAFSDTCLEYIYLLHDILYNRFDKNILSRILPELTKEDIDLSEHLQDLTPYVFFLSLWCFLKTNTYLDAVKQAINLNVDIIPLIVGSIAGLYYGIDGIPTELITKIEMSTDAANYIF